MILPHVAGPRGTLSMLTLLFDGIAYGMLLFVLVARAGRDDGA